MNTSIAAAIRAGDVILVSFPFSSGDKSAQRPAIVISHGEATSTDVNPPITVVPVTSSPRRLANPGIHDVQVGDWIGAGLRRPSSVRCDRLFTLQASFVHAQLGHLDARTLDHVKQQISAYLRLRS
jgi:mRNA-degrading endonuclease toxin of MazEF toxin-antitoxin module